VRQRCGGHGDAGQDAVDTAADDEGHNQQQDGGGGLTMMVV